MKFGKVEHPERIDFTLPADHSGTRPVLGRDAGSDKPKVYVGLAKWKRQDLEDFYPPGTADELRHYGTQFNAIELNATYYSFFSPSVFAGWKDRTPDGFVFFPKLHGDISHRKLLRDVQEEIDEFLDNASRLDHKLGTMFLQMHESFGPRPAHNTASLMSFIQGWPGRFPLAVELRHTDWFNDPGVAETLYSAFEEYGITNVITDAPGRRDILHMRLTTPRAFIRYVGANHDSDYTRLDDWIERLALWYGQGIREIGFFFHRNHQSQSPVLARYFIERLNDRIDCDLTLPKVSQPRQESLF